MSRISWIALIAAIGAAACASTNTAERPASTQSARAAAPSAQAPATASLSDEQLRNFAAARAEIAPLTANFASQTPEQRAQTTAQIRAIQQRHGLNAVTYDAIEAQARTDIALAGRIAGAQGFTDQQVQAFAQASVEIDPLNRSLAAATPEQRTQTAAQIRAVLQRHSLDGATYNAIAARAQSDQALQQRIMAAQQQAAPTTPPG